MQFLSFADYETIESILMRAGSLCCVEDKLSKESHRLLLLQDSCTRFSSEKLKSPSEIDGLFLRVKKMADTILGTRNILSPALSMGNEVRYSGGVIYLSREKPAKTVSGLAHEYTHYIQDIYLGLDTILEELTEGHAAWVELKVAELYAGSINNPSYLYESLSLQVARLRAAYKWICSRIGLPPSKEILSNNLRIKPLETEILFKEGRPSVHSFGVAFFSVWESMHGKGVYRSFLDGRLPI